MGYSSATWKRSPPGDLDDKVFLYHGDLRVEWRRGRVNPTVEVGYSKGRYNFATSQAFIQQAEPEFYMVLLGVTVPVKGVDFFALAGMAHVEYNPQLVEILPSGEILPHAGTPDDKLPVIKLGVGKYYGKEVQIGPEVGLEIYPDGLGFSRCRDLGIFPVIPWGGIRIKF